MAEFLSRDEIDALLDIAEQGEDIGYSTKNTTATLIRYNETLNKFYPSKSGYETEAEAKFHFYYNNMTSLLKDIDYHKSECAEKEEKVKQIKNNYGDLFIKFSEELL